MRHIIVVGGGVAGLATALMLSMQGHDITVLERDPGPVPETPAQSWHSWERDGVMQFRQPHLLHPGGWQVLERELPEVAQALRTAGGVAWNRLSFRPPTIKDRAPRAGDVKFDAVNARRPVLEQALAAAAESRVDVRRGIRVTGLVSDRPGHVAGVRTGPGTELLADLVIDAAGRRSPLPAWLAAAGTGQLAEEAQDLGFTYYTRFFRTRDEGPAPSFEGDIYTPLDSAGILVVPADAGTWSVTVYINSRDHALKALRAEASWDRLLAACPLHQRLIAGLDPITGVLPASGIVNRIRHLVADGVPAATGILPVGDSWACTNPSLGRGLTLAFMHAAITAEAVAEHPGNPQALALEHHRKTTEQLTPWYLNSAQVDQARLAQMSTASGDAPAPAPPPGPAATRLRNLVAAANWDADLFRTYCELASMLARPDEIFARPGMTELVNQAAAEHRPPPPLGPTRAEALQLLS